MLCKPPQVATANRIPPRWIARVSVSVIGDPIANTDSATNLVTVLSLRMSASSSALEGSEA